MIFLILPLPPSLNDMYRSVNGGSILSEAARNWYDLAIPLIQKQAGDWYTEKPVCVRYSYYFASKRPDIFNYEKALSDGMTKAHIWKDDRQIYLGEVKRMPVDRMRPRVECQIWELH